MGGQPPRLTTAIEQMGKAIAALQQEMEVLRGLAESCEYYMDLADRRGRVIDSLRAGADEGVPTPCQITTRCTYLMTQEDLDD